MILVATPLGPATKLGELEPNGVQSHSFTKRSAKAKFGVLLVFAWLYSVHGTPEEMTSGTWALL